MTLTFFASDLHGSLHRYERLFERIAEERPAAVFLGGDLFPSGFRSFSLPGIGDGDFVTGFLEKRLAALREDLGEAYPRIFTILGNDDPRFEEPGLLSLSARRLLEYVSMRRTPFMEGHVFGYPYVPPSPFRLKDWERYDVSRYVDPGCLSPEEGGRSVPVSEHEARYSTIKEDLDRLAGNRDLSASIFLFHAPPYKTPLDRAALDGKMIDHVPLDVHVGSIAIARFIEERAPAVTLHGHIHEAPRLTGAWRCEIGETTCLTAAHDGPELALVRFHPWSPAGATRELI